VVEAVALYPDRTELKEEYPELEDDDIRQALSRRAKLGVSCGVKVPVG
jgi:uncharacterized protein (DUF433 family)